MTFRRGYRGSGTAVTTPPPAALNRRYDPDWLTVDHLAPARTPRGMLVRGFFHLLRLWPTRRVRGPFTTPGRVR